MNEAEWLATNKAEDVFRTGLHRSSMRKTRLLVCAYCRHLWANANNEQRQAVIELAERYVDGAADEGELWPTFDAVKAGTIDCEGSEEDMRSTNFTFALMAVDASLSIKAVLSRFEGVVRARSGQRRSNRSPVQQVERNIQAGLVRDIFGNPFRSVAFSSDWRTDTAVTLARQMYESREFGAMPILADALQDAGCDSDDILAHCRGPGPHVRGCWVVDLVLGKE